MVYIDGGGVGDILAISIVLLSTIKFPSGSSLIGVPEMVIPASPAVNILPLMDKTEGLPVNSWSLMGLFDESGVGKMLACSTVLLSIIKFPFEVQSDGCARNGNARSARCYCSAVNC